MTTSTVTQGTMGDKEILADLLTSQKHVTASYNTYAGECKCTELRDAFLNILDEEHCIQSDLFTELNSRGWYPTKDAPVNEIQATKQMFVK